MTYTEKIQARGAAAHGATEVLKNSKLAQTDPWFVEMFEDIASRGLMMEQRIGQVICNYILTDYRSTIIEDDTVRLMDLLFPGNPDPFFEESVDTLERWKQTDL